MDKPILEYANWPYYYGSESVPVYAPEYYHAETVVRGEEYSEKIRESKNKDLSDYFWPFMEKMLDSITCDADLVTAMPSSTPGKVSPTIKSMAKRISEHLNLPLESVLERIKESGTKGRKSHDVRFENVRGSLKIDQPKKIVGKKILIVDDTRATGMNMLEANKELKAGGAIKVLGISLGCNESVKYYKDRIRGGKK